eukprot:350085-Chlamydomonas_euryale.AAC.1
MDRRRVCTHAVWTLLSCAQVVQQNWADGWIDGGSAHTLCGHCLVVRKSLSKTGRMDGSTEGVHTRCVHPWNSSLRSHHNRHGVCCNSHGVCSNSHDVCTCTTTAGDVPLQDTTRIMSVISDESIVSNAVACNSYGEESEDAAVAELRVRRRVSWVGARVGVGSNFREGPTGHMMGCAAVMCQHTHCPSVRCTASPRRRIPLPAPATLCSPLPRHHP